MTKLSVNIKKIATLRNALGDHNTDVVRVALDCERFGAQGITVHPRPDERHIRYDDVRRLKSLLTTELNIEGNPIRRFADLVLEVKPAQVTLVPDGDDQLSCIHGWDTQANQPFLTDIIGEFRAAGIRVSVFVDADPLMVDYAARCGADRVELYTEPYAAAYAANREEAIRPFIAAAKAAKELGLGVNDGLELRLYIIRYYRQQIAWTDEVSIGHALVCDALYMGLDATIKAYLDCLNAD